MCASQTRLFPRQWALCCKTARCGYSDDEIKNIDFNRPFHVGAKPVPCNLRRLKMSRRIFYPCRLPCLRGRAAGRCCCVAKPDDSTRKRLFRSTRSFPVEKTEQKKYNGNRPEAKGLRPSVRLVPPSFRRSRKNMSLLTASSAESRWRGYECFAHKKSAAFAAP